MLNDTASWYRYFDATAHAEFLYHCVQTTVQSDLPHEVAYLHAFDTFMASVSAIVDMPARTLDLLHRFLRQNNGRLSRRARERELSHMTDAEAVRIEVAFAESMRDIPKAASDEDA